MIRKLVLFVLILAMSFAIGCSTEEEKALTRDLKAKDPEIRRAAALKLGEVATPDALRLLELQTDDPDIGVREAVRESIAKIKKRTFLK